MNRAISALHGRFGRACLYSQTRPMAVHAHREAHLIFHLDGQAADFVVAGRSCLCGPDTAVAVNPFEPHQVSYRSGDVACLMLVLYVEPEWFAAFGDGASGALRFGEPVVVVTAELRGLVDAVVGALLRGESRVERIGERERHSSVDLASAGRDRRDDERAGGRDDVALDVPLHALCRLSRARSWQRSRQRALLHRPTVVSDPRVRRSARLLERSVGEEVSLDAVAREVGLSRPHFFKLFRENVGVTPKLYLNAFRTERAIERLVGTAQPVTSIGLDLGFASQASFTRFFSANVGIPPTDYRRVAHIA